MKSVALIPFHWIKHVFSCLLCVLVVLLSSPYEGIRHDSILYLGQALFRLQPEIFRQDLFFQFGSQASFTLFPLSIAWLLEKCHAGTVFLVLTLLAKLFFALASWIFLRNLLPVGFRLPALLALLLLPTSYGSYDIFQYTEPFLTARSYAEPLILLALAALLQKRLWVALIFWGVGAALHPLMALPALVIGWFYLLQTNRHWIHVLWAMPAILLIILFTGLLPALSTSFDSEWLESVWSRSSYLFYSKSKIADWFYLLADLFIIFVLIQKSSDQLQRYAKALLAASLLLFGMSLLLVDILQLTLPASLQFWRVHWLLHWLAMACLPWIVWRHAQERDWLKLALFLAVVLSGIQPMAANPGLPGLIGLYAAWPWIEKRLNPACQYGIVCLAVVVALLHAWTYHMLLFAPVALSRQTIFYAVRIFIIVVLLFFLPVYIARKGNFSALTNLTLVAIVFSSIIFVQGLWDQRKQKTILYENTNPLSQPFGIELEKNSQILWLNELLPTWMTLGRASYMSNSQMAGIVFNRQTAIHANRRNQLLHTRTATGNDCAFIKIRNDPSYIPCTPDEHAMRQVCLQTAGALDYIVLPYKLALPLHGIWTYSKNNRDAAYLYACRDLASSSSPITK